MAIEFKANCDTEDEPIVITSPDCVIKELPKVSESVTEPAPSHNATVEPVPTPDNTDELSIFCH